MVLLVWFLWVPTYSASGTISDCFPVSEEPYKVSYGSTDNIPIFNVQQHTNFEPVILMLLPVEWIF